MKRSIVFVLAFAVLIGGVLAGVSLATSGSGTVSTQFGRSTFSKFHTRMGSGDIVVTENSFAPGGYSGWHSHPGKVVIAVQRGEITIYRGSDPKCAGTTYASGDVFVERPSDVYNGVNESATIAAVVNATYFNVPVGGSVRIDQPKPPNCPS
jgi:quercetin dioxygenase-like cupin family protein